MRSVIFKLWLAASMLLACYISESYLLLVWIYGFWRVHKEGLHFTYMPSSHDVDDYLVSNGDHIAKTDGFMALPIAIVVWGALIALGYFLLFRLFRVRKVANDA